MRKLLCSLFLFVAPAFAQYIPTAFTASAGGGGVSIVQPTSGSPLNHSCAQFTTTNTCAFPSNVTSGNNIYILVMAGSTGTIGTPSKSAGTATIGTVTAVGAGSTSGGAQQWYTASVTGTGSLTIQEVFSAGANQGLLIFEVHGQTTGVDGSPVYHAVASSFCASSCALGSITPGATNDLLMGGMIDGAGTITYTFSPYTASGCAPGTAGNDIQWCTYNYTAPSTSIINPTFNPSSALGGQSYQDAIIAVK